MIGNFIADWIKGNLKNYENKYPPEILKGITIHRFIDSYTDTHPVVLKSIHRMHKYAGHYSGIIIDMVYDHFLASQWEIYTNSKLQVFTRNFYASCLHRYNYLPSRIKFFLPYLIASDRLKSYEHLIGIYNSLKIMQHTSSMKISLDNIYKELIINYDYFKEEFNVFFPLITKEVSDRFFTDL